MPTNRIPTDMVEDRTTKSKLSDTIKTLATQDQLNQIVAEAGSNNPEVVQARGTFPVLNDRLTNNETQLAENTQQLSDIIQVNLRSYGAKGDDSTDDTQAFINAVSATPPCGTLIIPKPSSKYKITDTIDLTTKPIRIISETSGSYDLNTDTLKGTIIKYYGVSGKPMFKLSKHYDGTVFENINLDGNNLATYGIYADRLQRGSMKNVNIINATIAELMLTTETTVANDNTMWNHFENIYLKGTKGLLLSGLSDGTANCCHNTFVNVKVDYSGECGIDLDQADNNTFLMTYEHRISGTGNGVIYRKGAYNNYFFHLQPSVGGVLVMDGSNAGMIMGYDKANGQTEPTLQGTGKLTWFEMGSNAFGLFVDTIYPSSDKLRFWQNNDNPYNFRNNATGNEFEIRTNASTREIEFWTKQGGDTFEKVFAIKRGSGFKFYDGDFVKGHKSVLVQLDFPSIPAYSTTEMTTTVTGASSGDTVVVTPAGSPPAGIMWSGASSPTADIVVIRMANITAAAIDSTARYFRIDLWKH